MTFGNDPQLIAPVLDILMKSFPALIDYQQPLGLNFLDIDRADTHYGPWPWYNEARRPDWGDVYFHRADAEGLGFDRSATGYNSVAQYNSPLKEEWGDVRTTPEDLLLWFHHVSWDYHVEIGPHAVGGTAVSLSSRCWRGGDDAEDLGELEERD